MATITIDIPDAQLPRVRTALCHYIGLTAAPDITNPNAKAGLIQLVRNTVRSQEALVAQAAAEAAIDPTVPDIT